MPRLGQNPAKFVEGIAQPAPVLVAVISYLPFLRGYYHQGLEVLKVCLESVRRHTQGDYDLMVFDNASCREVREFLLAEHQSGGLQYLLLSETNLGKVGAWNFIFGAASGEYLAYADSDVYFCPGWLERHLQIFDAYPGVGSVTGQPRRQRRDFTQNTIRALPAHPDIQVDLGDHIPRTWIEDHDRSLGKVEEGGANLPAEDYRLTCRGVPAYVTAQHYQFVIRSELARSMVPFRTNRPMGADVAQFDAALDARNLLRLAVADRLAIHMGNTLEIAPQLPAVAAPRAAQPRGRFWDMAWVRRLLLGIHDRIFRLYYRPGR